MKDTKNTVALVIAVVEIVLLGVLVVVALNEGNS